MAKFQGLRKLFMYKMHITGQINENELQLMCPMVTDLCLPLVHPVGPFLKSWGTNITTLSVLPSYNGEENHFPDCDLSSVKRLYFRSLDYNQSAALLNISKNASEISLIPISSTCSEFDSLINRCIARPKLEFLHTAARSAESIRRYCNAIKQGLNDTKNVEGRWMEIALTVEAARGISDADDFVQSVMTIIKGFTECKMKEWMFVVEFWYDQADEDPNIKNVQKQLEASPNSTNAFPSTVDMISCTTEELVITSNGCSMQRHKRWWREE